MNQMIVASLYKSLSHNDPAIGVRASLKSIYYSTRVGLHFRGMQQIQQLSGLASCRCPLPKHTIGHKLFQHLNRDSVIPIP